MIEAHEQDGIPAFFTHRAGPMVAGISFRVGIADESLPTRGITHMVEHLALHALSEGDYHANGQTGASITTFHVMGSVDRCGSFLTQVCESLAHLPTERLESERRIIQTEEQGRSGTSDLGIWRHGSTGYGLTSYPEWGIPGLTAEQVTEWSECWFTRANAHVWVIGEERPSFALPLRDGQPTQMPHLTSMVPTFPAWYASGRRHVSFDSIVSRRSAATITAGLLQKEFFRRLRTDHALSYGVAANYDGFDAELAGLSIFADALEENEDALVGEFIDGLAAVRAGRLATDAGVEAIREKALEGFSHPDFDSGRIVNAASDALFGRALASREELMDELRQVTAQEVQEVVDEAFSTMLLRVPDGTSAEWGGFTSAPLWSDSAVSGTRYPMRGQGEEVLIVGDDGVSVVNGDSIITVRFADTQLCLAWPDGAVRLFGSDGLSLVIEPTLHSITQDHLHWLYNQVAPERYVTQPARSPDDIPQPVPVAEVAPEKRKLFRRKKQ